MGWPFSKTQPTPTQTPTQSPPQRTSLRDLTDDERADIEFLLDDGTRPSDIAMQTGVDVRLVYHINRERNRNIPREPVRPARLAPIQVAPPIDDERARIRAEIEESKLRDELARVKADIEYNERKRQLELERLELELEQKRAELYGDDEEQEGPGWGEVAQDPENAMWNFFGKVLDKQAMKQQNAPAPGPALPDVTKPLTVEQVRAYLARFTPDQINDTRMMPAMIVKREIGKQFPGITEQNINLVMNEIRHYGREVQPQQRSQEGSGRQSEVQQQSIERSVEPSEGSEKRQRRRSRPSADPVISDASTSDRRPRARKLDEYDDENDESVK